MNAADRKYKSDFLARDIGTGDRVFHKTYGVGTMHGVGGNYAEIEFDADGGGSVRAIMFEEIEPAEATR